MYQRFARSFFFGSTIRSRSFCQKWIYNPIRSDPFTLLRKGSTIRYFQILIDPFWSDPYHVYLRIQFHKSCVFWNLTTFLTIARSHKIMILLRNANFSLKNAICLWKITGWENLFFIFKKIWLSFVQKDLEKKSDHFRSDPWFLDLRIRSRSSRRKWIYDPITILKNGDLDPKGSRSDHDRQISAYMHSLYVWERRQILYYSVHILRKDYLKIHKTSIWRGSNIWYKPVHKLSGLFTEIGYSAKAAVGR